MNTIMQNEYTPEYMDLFPSSELAEQQGPQLFFVAFDLDGKTHVASGPDLDAMRTGLQNADAENVREITKAEAEALNVPSLDFIKAAKFEELKTAYEHAFANAIDPADPSPANVAVKAALWAAKDAEGLLALRDRLDKDCKRMEAAINSCTTIQEVEEIEIAFSL